MGKRGGVDVDIIIIGIKFRKIFSYIDNSMLCVLIRIASMILMKTHNIPSY